MLRLVGALLLTAGAAGLGLCAAGQLGERVRSLRSLVGGLEILKRDSDKLELVARYLLAFETMDADTFQLVYDDPQALAQQIPPEEVESNG